MCPARVPSQHKALWPYMSDIDIHTYLAVHAVVLPVVKYDPYHGGRARSSCARYSFPPCASIVSFSAAFVFGPIVQMMPVERVLAGGEYRCRA